MDRAEQLEQQIWEFVYGVLSEDEADAMRQQITSDPEVARLYADVKLQSELVADAMRMEVPPIALRVPSESEAGSDHDHIPASPTGTRAPARRSAMRTLQWAATLAATLLVGFIGYSYLQPRSPLRPVAFQSERAALDVAPIQAKVLGPSRLQPRPANYLAVVTRSLNGQSRSAKVAYRLYDEADGLLAADQSRTDANGILQIATPAELDARFVRLEVETLEGLRAAPLTHTFAVDPAELMTHVNLDKPLCRPGETLRYRTVTLSRYDLRVREEVPVTITIEDAGGNLLPSSQNEGMTERGVRHGEYQIPADLPGGQYEVVARSPQQRFPDARRRLLVRHYPTPRFRKRLEFARESYAPGDEVTARFSAERAAGGALAGASLRVRATIDGQVRLDRNLSTDPQGTADLAFVLPRDLQRGEGQLTIDVVGAEGAEVFRKPIPIHLGTVHVDFFPESGDLVAGVENRVYFRARDEKGKPVHIAGRIVDESDRVEAVVETLRDGRGAFRLVPRESAAYRLRIESPRDAGVEPLLPAPNPQQFVVLDAAPGVFEAGADLAVEIRSTDCTRPLAIIASCRGVVVGQQIVATERLAVDREAASSAACSVALPVAEHAEGVIRLTAYDLSEQPARPVAERLVYRQPRQKLEFEWEGMQTQYGPGDPVDLTVYVRDEAGRAQRALLGLAVVDDSLLTLADDHAASLTTQFWLTGQIADARDLENADFYLDPDEPDAAQALDLLLGTQGWRRLAMPVAGMLAGQAAQRDELRSLGLPATRQVTAEEPAAPLVLADNVSEVRAAAEKAAAALRSMREVDLRRLGLTVLLASLIVLVAIVIVSLALQSGGLRDWAPQLVTASICLILGIFWVSAGIDSQGRVTLTTRRAPPAERQVAERGAAESPSLSPAAPEPPVAPSEYDFQDERRRQVAADKETAGRETAQRPMAAAAALENEPAAENGKSFARLPEKQLARDVVADEAASAAGNRAAASRPAGLAAGEEAAPAEEEDAVPADAASNLADAPPLTRGGPAMGQAGAARPAVELPALAPPASAATSPGAVEPRSMGMRAPAPAEPAGPGFGSAMPGLGGAPAESALPRLSQPADSAARTFGAPAAAAPADEAALADAPAADAPAEEAPAAEPAAPARPALADVAGKAERQGEATEMAAESERLDMLAEKDGAAEAKTARRSPAGYEEAEEDRAAGAAEVASATKGKTAATERKLAEGGTLRERAKSEPQLQFGGGGGRARPDSDTAVAGSSSKKDHGARHDDSYRHEPMPADALGRRSDAISAAGRLENEQLALPQVMREYAEWDAYTLPGFEDLAESDDATRYWNPWVEADEQGRCPLRFTVPDVETTYRVSVDGHLRGRIGSAQAEIVVRKKSP